MQQKVESLEAVSGLWPQVKALSYLELKALSDAIAGEMQEKSDAVRADLRQRMADLSEQYGLSVKDVLGKKRRRAKKAEPTGEPKLEIFHAIPKDQAAAIDKLVTDLKNKK